MTNILATLTQKSRLDKLLTATRIAFEHKLISPSTYYNFSFCKNLTTSLSDQASLELTWLFVLLKTNQQTGHTSLQANKWQDFTQGWSLITNFSKAIYNFRYNIDNDINTLNPVWFKQETTQSNLETNRESSLSKESIKQLHNLLNYCQTGLELTEIQTNTLTKLSQQTIYGKTKILNQEINLINSTPRIKNLFIRAKEFSEYLNSLEYLESLTNQIKNIDADKTIYSIVKDLDYIHKLDQIQDQNNSSHNQTDNTIVTETTSCHDDNSDYNLHEIIKLLYQPSKVVDWVRYIKSQNPESKLSEQDLTLSLLYFVVSRIRLNLIIKHGITTNIRPTIEKFLSKLNKTQLKALSNDTNLIAFIPALGVLITNLQNTSSLPSDEENISISDSDLTTDLIVDNYANPFLESNLTKHLAFNLFVGLNYYLASKTKLNFLLLDSKGINLFLIQQIAQTFNLDLTDQNSWHELSFYYDIIYHHTKPLNTKDYNLVLKILTKAFGEKFEQAVTKDELYEFITNDYALLKELDLEFAHLNLDNFKDFNLTNINVSDLELAKATSHEIQNNVTNSVANNVTNGVQQLRQELAVNFNNLIQFIPNEQRLNYLNTATIYTNYDYEINHRLQLDFAKQDPQPLPLFVMSCNLNSTHNYNPLSDLTISLSLAYAQESKVLSQLLSRITYDYSYQNLLATGTYVGLGHNRAKLIFPIGGFKQPTHDYTQLNLTKQDEFNSQLDNVQDKIKEPLIEEEQAEQFNQILLSPALPDISQLQTIADLQQFYQTYAQYPVTINLVPNSAPNTNQHLDSSLDPNHKPLVELIDSVDNYIEDVYGSSPIASPYKISTIVNQDSLSKQMFVFLNTWRGVSAYTEQQVAIAGSLNRGFSCIMGGPGTGKTTTVFNILLIDVLCQQLTYKNKEFPEVSLTSPTGKASEHLKSSIVEKTQELIDYLELFTTLEHKLNHTYSQLTHTNATSNLDDQNANITTTHHLDLASIFASKQFNENLASWIHEPELASLSKFQANFSQSNFAKLFVCYYYLDHSIKAMLPKALIAIKLAQAQTIHKQLGISPYYPYGSYYGEHSQKHTADIIIIDEVGMIELSIMEILTQAYQPQAQLIFLGDANQLPAVGIGYILKNLDSQNSAYSQQLQQILGEFGMSGNITQKPHTDTKTKADIKPDHNLDLVNHDINPDLSSTSPAKLVIGDYIHYLVKSYRYRSKQLIQDYSEKVNKPDPSDNLGYFLSQNILNPQERNIFTALQTNLVLDSKLNHNTVEADQSNHSESNSHLKAINSIDAINEKQEIYVKVYEVAYAQYQALMAYGYSQVQLSETTPLTRSLSQIALDLVTKIYVKPTNQEFVENYLLQHAYNFLPDIRTNLGITYKNTHESNPYTSAIFGQLVQNLNQLVAQKLNLTTVDLNKFDQHLSLNNYSIYNLLDQLPTNFSQYLLHQDSFSYTLKQQFNLSSFEKYKQYVKTMFKTNDPTKNYSLNTFSKILVLEACKQAFTELELLTANYIELLQNFERAKNDNSLSSSDTKSDSIRTHISSTDHIHSLHSTQSHLQLTQELLTKIFNFLSNTKFLCPMRKGSLGVDTLNALFLEQYKFSKCPPIQITKNQDNIGLLNGDIGIILPTNAAQTKFCAYFNKIVNGSFLKIPFEELSNYENAFFTTIHKSQGDEFDNTHVVLPLQLNDFISRAMYYTAITRVKKRLYLYFPEVLFTTQQFNSLPVQTSLDFNWDNCINQANH